MGYFSLYGNGNIRIEISCGNLLYRLRQSFNISCRLPLQKKKAERKKNDAQKYKKQDAYHTGKSKALYHGMIISHLIKIAGIGTDVKNQKTFHYTRKNSRHSHMEKNLHHIPSTEMVRCSFLIHLTHSYFSILYPTPQTVVIILSSLWSSFIFPRSLRICTITVLLAS